MSWTKKYLLRPERVRKVPRSFSWIDHRLIRDGHLLRLQPHEILLYFFLVLVGDREGLSYYALRSISSYLKLSPQEIELARTSLCERGLIAHREPLYQVLSLPEEVGVSRSSSQVPRGGQARSIGEILQGLLKKTPHE